MELRLVSPLGGADDIVYEWPGESSKTRLSEEEIAKEVEATVRHICRELPSLIMPPFTFSDEPTYDDVLVVCEEFNGAAREYAAVVAGRRKPLVPSRPSRSLLKHIIQQVYNQAVDSPERLNQYSPFSPEVYGETSFDLVDQMINEIKITADDVFIDLGSGVGQVVLQMAASTPCRMCIGIEKAPVPTEYASLFERHFVRALAWYGKTCGPYRLIEGDFLDDEHSAIIQSASIIFANNFAFGPLVDHQLKQKFADLSDGSRIVSSMPFCPMNFRISHRNLSDIGTIMHVSQLQPFRGEVSWTCKPVAFYLHVIDRTKLERYFQKNNTVKKVKDDSDKPVERTKVKSFRRKEQRDRNRHRIRPRVTARAKLRNEVDDDDEYFEDFESETNSTDIPPLPRSEDNTSCFESLSTSSQVSPISQPELPRLNGPPRNLDEFMAHMRAAVASFMDAMGSSSFRETTRKQISDEQSRNDLLRKRVSNLERDVAKLLAEGSSLIQERMSEFGVDVNDVNDVSDYAKQLIEANAYLKFKHAEESGRVERLIKENNQLEETRKLEVLQLCRTQISRKRHLRNTIGSLTREVANLENSMDASPLPKRHKKIHCINASAYGAKSAIRNRF